MKDKIQIIWGKTIGVVKVIISKNKKGESFVKIITAILDEKHELAHAMIAHGHERKPIGMETLDAIQSVVDILNKHSDNNIISDKNIPQIIEDFKLAYENYCTDFIPEKVVVKMLFEEILLKIKVIEDGLP